MTAARKNGEVVRSDDMAETIICPAQLRESQKFEPDPNYHSPSASQGRQRRLRESAADLVMHAIPSELKEISPRHDKLAELFLQKVNQLVSVR